MQEALKNPHYKKIWERVILNNNPSEDTLIDALLSEASNDDCLFIQNGYIGIPQVFSNDCGYAYAFNFCSDYNYENNRRISFYDDEERKRYDVNTGVLLEEYTEEILNKERVLQHILGRPITLFDILNLLNPNKEDSVYVADGTKIYFIDKNAKGTKIFCDFTSNLLEEQSEDTWETISNSKIANLI